jgi:hypothetical protein
MRKSILESSSGALDLSPAAVVAWVTAVAGGVAHGGGWHGGGGWYGGRPHVVVGFAVLLVGPGLLGLGHFRRDWGDMATATLWLPQKGLVAPQPAYAGATAALGYWYSVRCERLLPACRRIALQPPVPVALQPQP